ncbi:class I SAM-dependent methyltransferase [Nocardia vermiculata]|uniref:Class I SAM-dependent methyltransferase n=1 Tax=Nocardia vermiculata TaxID=257274 RepID=A0A846Y249_9NOCA|nr:class I SAM-dependent methyltransferase [Nocardia vermiculata]NKY52917.1 class I SAM-dependent methyltransferase [Nocardia vermiculata]
MGALDWDHNAYYHRLLLRQLPSHCERVLEVGCGAGALATELAVRADRVDAFDRAPEMIAAARQVVPANVTCTDADILEYELPAAAYDAVVSLTVLHHMPLDEVLPRLERALRPGGVLAVIALPRADPAREWPAEIAAALGHRVFGGAFAALRATNTAAAGSAAWFAHEPTHADMPMVLDPPLTTRDVARCAAAVLPGARVRRLVFWRYLLLWRKPPQPHR